MTSSSARWHFAASAQLVDRRIQISGNAAHRPIKPTEVHKSDTAVKRFLKKLSYKSGSQGGVLLYGALKPSNLTPVSL